MQTAKKPNHIPLYRHYLDCCEKLGIGGMEDAMNRMLVLDFLIANEDRHLNNFGVVRNADTLEYEGAAPIYDSGTSLWWDRPLRMINAGAAVTCKPFKTSHEEQIRLVTDFDWIDFAALEGIDEELREITADSLFVDEARCEALCRGLLGRIRLLRDLCCVRPAGRGFSDSTEHDVTQDLAYSGESE